MGYLDFIFCFLGIFVVSKGLLLFKNLGGGWKMNRCDWQDIFFMVAMIVVMLFFMIKKARSVLYSSELIQLKKDLEIIDDLIERLDRHGEKYIDTIYRLRVIKDGIQWKINQIKGGQSNG